MPKYRPPRNLGTHIPKNKKLSPHFYVETIAGETLFYTQDEKLARKDFNERKENDESVILIAYAPLGTITKELDRHSGKNTSLPKKN